MTVSARHDPLLNPENHALLLIDHQYLQMLTTRSHEVGDIINNVAAVAEGAKIFNVSTLVTTAFAEKQNVVSALADATSDQVPIDRTTLNSWEDPRITDWVKAKGKRKLVMAGQWTEVCLAMPVLSALADGYEVYIITDASGGATKEAHDMAVQRMVQAGAVPMTTWAYVSELQRDWARETAGAVSNLFAARGGGFGQGLRWQWQLLALKEGSR
ncbi:hydrolase [Phenylobacterium hankyongense]|uniref:Hydrolase n=1 Tax=Phenylobacterium hankyongense TaxID=1813876 RepID=A0A328B398_9CAUL|nr:isochorismatase family protein [Phenylobacterium hankyongense]RAK61307.1 hydrolase [Phenylobacterium hankyongense]